MNILPELDRILIHLYRMSGNAVIDYFLGTFLLALICVVLGKITFAWILRLNGNHVEGLAKEMEDRHKLSMAALNSDDQKAYKAINNQASDAYGKYYFNMAALSLASLWPVPFALAWMQSRFQAVEFEFVHPLSLVLPSVGYFAIFVLCYVLARICVKNFNAFFFPHHGTQKLSSVNDQPST